MRTTSSYPHSLESLIEQFLKEKLGLSLLSILEVSVHHQHLIGGVDPLQPVGFVRFLKNRGISSPLTREHLSEFWISDYHEFLAQNVGDLMRQAAMESVRALWKWASQNYYIRESQEPGVFQFDKASPSFPISIQITDRPKHSRRRP
jgi:hypothetical protein